MPPGALPSPYSALPRSSNATQAAKRAPTAAAQPPERGTPPEPSPLEMQRRSRLQFLLEIAQATFAQAGPPTQAQIHALQRTLSAVPLEELGLGGHAPPPAGADADVDSSTSSRSSSPSLTDASHAALLGSLLEAEEAPRPPITYLLIYEDERVSLGIFCLPARARIPLHNHPGMTVLSRVLYGQMHVSSYDWADGSTEEEAPLPRAARVVLDRTLAAGDAPAVLFPTAGGNIHEFTAITDCAVLDLMSPPYSTEDGRDCTYYAVVPPPPQLAVGAEEVALDSFEPPTDFVINQGEYRGVQPRPKVLPLFAGGTSLFPSAGGAAGQSPSASCGPASAQQPGRSSGGGSPGVSSPIGSPTSEATGGPKISGLLSGGSSGVQAGSHMADCAASEPPHGWQSVC